MQELDSTGVSTMVFEMNATRWHNEIENATTLCDLAMKRTKHFLVFGSFSFVAQQFQQVHSVSSSFFFARLICFCSCLICDRPPRNESEVPSGCLELERKMDVGGVRFRF